MLEVLKVTVLIISGKCLYNELGQFYKHSKEYEITHTCCTSPSLINNCIESTESTRRANALRRFYLLKKALTFPEITLVAQDYNMCKQRFHAEHGSLLQCATIVKLMLPYLCIPDKMVLK